MVSMFNCFGVAEVAL